MFLKRIDLHGFKSFASKTSIEFAPGMTAVVGPNGSGKSNIADAMRWVLGEQSARNLRGAKMEDVIFAGTESKKPINFCEVSLTLDNADHHLAVAYQEVVVTRRVYRSGDSEYLINRQTCRLKDVHELFMDSGLGRESYSIVGQGKIEEMLSTRPEDRRGPFEDAAGIVKYRFRRKEAERRLEETAANLLRVQDIVAELASQSVPLQAEAERAGRFQELQSTLNALELGVLLFDISAMKTRLETAAADSIAAAHNRRVVAADLASQQGKLEAAKRQLEAQTSAIDTLQRQLLEQTDERQRRLGHIALLAERILHSQKEQADKTAQLDGLRQERTKMEQTASEVELRRQQLAAQLDAKRTELAAAIEAVNPERKVELEAMANHLNAEIIEAHHDAATARNEIKAAHEALDAEDRRQQRLQSDLVCWQGEAAELDGQLRRGDEERAALSRELELGQHAVAATNDAICQLAEQEITVAAEWQQAKATQASAKSRMELLRDLQNGYDGYAQGARTVLQAAAKGQLPGVYGSVASLLETPTEVETAIETALGAALQNVVVASEADARAGIALLKSRQAGRATFMPIDVIRARALPENDKRVLASIDGFVGVASELVGASSEFSNVVQHLLGTIAVARTLASANAIARQLKYRVRVVTLDGDVVHPGGMMSGGSHVRKGPGLLGRSRELSLVAEQLQALDGQLLTLSARQHDLRGQIADARTGLTQLLTQRERENEQLHRLESSRGAVGVRRNALQERLAAAQWELQQATSGSMDWQARAERAQAMVAELDSALVRLQAAAAATRAELARSDAAAGDLQQTLTCLRVDEATLAQEQAGVGERIQEMRERLGRLLEREQQLSTEIQQADRATVDSSAAVTDVQEQADALAESVTSLQELVLQAKAQRHAWELDVAQTEQVLRQQQAQVSAAEEAMHRAQASEERLDAELRHAVDRLGEAHHMTWEWAIAHASPAVKPEESRREVDQLRRNLDAMGEVRIGAIAEWERLSERISYLTSERDDLARAESTLQGVIREIDVEMSRRFAQTFTQIRDEFLVMFKELFNGGRADLQLLDPDDVLHSGIEVTAQPPGKKQQNLNLLSGGERALIAMALLFAILRVRPVPFCVLDEVEAALDEANVARFAQQLRRMAAETQFILITHRRSTMEAAEVMYGVAMQESGVSSLVSVRLTDDAEFDSA